MTRDRPHRILLLVSWKSSAVLKRALKVHSDTLQQYTLKLLKSQVPYMGRKWRNANMKIVSGIYYHLDPRLKEDYLAGEYSTDPESALVWPI